MPLELESLDDLKSYIDGCTYVSIFYSVDAPKITVVAGKVAWSGTFTIKEELDDFETWLLELGAMKIKGWADLEELFA